MSMNPKQNKKVKIFSYKRDVSTNNVMDWLFDFGCDCDRINSVSISTASEISFEISVNQNNFENNRDYTSVWFRKNWFYNSDLENSNKLVKKHLNKELSTFQASLFRIFQASNTIRVLGTNGLTDSYCDVNKPYVLFVANSIGINIPATLISNSTEEIKKFQEKYVNIISKPVSDPTFFWGQSSSYSMYTSEVRDDIPDIERCFPTMFQQNIDKEIEIRSFFIDGKFYSSAIFSQSDSQTTTDFRNYNDKQPNRCVPYKLPSELSRKLMKLMRTLNLNTGSIDIMLSKEGLYYFLEVNPVGQFGMISLPCNYHIDKIIAKYLKNEK